MADVMLNNTVQPRILIIDDNLEAAEMIQMLLDLEGYETLVASDGTTALSLADTYRPHAICSDINMPGISGFTFAEKFRKAEHSKNTLLVAITGRTDEDTLKRLTAAGFDTYFFKPMAFDKLSEALRAFFRSYPAIA